MTARQIHKIYKSKPTIEGAGVNLKRAFVHKTKDGAIADSAFYSLIFI